VRPPFRPLTIACSAALCVFSWLSPLCLLASPIIRAHYCLLHTHRFRNVLGNPPSFFFVFFRPRFGLVLVPFRVPLRPRRALVSHRPSESSCLIAALLRPPDSSELASRSDRRCLFLCFYFKKII
jgi:hypothetical protein